MKRSMYLIIISIVTILCILIGAFSNLRYSGRGFRTIKRAVEKTFSSGDYDYDYDFDIDSDLVFEDDDLDEGTLEFDNEELSKFDTVAVEGSVLGLAIERGNSYSISSKYSRPSLKPEYSLRDGKLYIKQRNKIKSLIGNNKCEVKITVPFGATIKKLDVDVDVGAVELSGFDVDTASVRTDVGAVAVSKLDFNDLYIKSDVGAVAIELLEDIKLYDIDASSDIGAIQIGALAVKRRFSQKGSNGKGLRLKTNVGGIEIK